jgi:hypothetical protein
MIFISYRRDDCRHVAERVYDRLAAHFGKQSVFKDVDSIPLGRDFRQVIQGAVGRCDVLVAVIGPSWLTRADEKGHRRLDNPEDYVRLEIESALQRDIPVIPLLVDHAPMPGVEQLPEGLKKLSFLNGIEVRPDPDFQNDMVRLISSCDETLQAGNADSIQRRPGSRRFVVVGVTALLLMSVLALGVLAIYRLPALLSGSATATNATNQSNSQTVAPGGAPNASPVVAPSHLVDLKTDMKQSQIDELLRETVGLVVNGYEVTQADGSKEEKMLSKGTCFAVTNDGYLLTAQFVVEEIEKLKNSQRLADAEKKANAKVTPKTWIFFGREDKHEVQNVILSHNFDMGVLKIDRQSKHCFALAAQEPSEIARRTPVMICAFQQKITGLPSGTKSARYVEQYLTEENFDFELGKGAITSKPQQYDANSGFRPAWCIVHDARMLLGSGGSPLLLDNGTVVGINAYSHFEGPDRPNSNIALTLSQMRKEIDKLAPGVTWR